MVYVRLIHWRARYFLPVLPVCYPSDLRAIFIFLPPPHPPLLLIRRGRS